MHDLEKKRCFLLCQIVKKIDVNKNDNVNRVIRSKYLHVELMKSLSECLSAVVSVSAQSRAWKRGEIREIRNT